MLIEISVPNFNTMNFRSFTNFYVSYFFFRKCDSFQDISVQLALGTGRVGSGRAGSSWKWVQGVKTNIFCFLHHMSKTLRFRDIQLFCFPIYRYRSSLALRREPSLCELASLRSASLAITFLRCSGTIYFCIIRTSLFSKGRLSFKYRRGSELTQRYRTKLDLLC